MQKFLPCPHEHDPALLCPFGITRFRRCPQWITIRGICASVQGAKVPHQLLRKGVCKFLFSIFLKYIVKRVKIYLCCGNCVFLSASSLDRVFWGDKENPNKIDILGSSPRKTEAYVKRIDIDPFLSDLLIVSLLLCSCCVFACLPSSTAVRDSLRMDPKSSFRVFLR